MRTDSKTIGFGRPTRFAACMLAVMFLLLLYGYGPGGSGVSAAGNPEGTNCVRLNFRGAAIEEVLEYLSEAAGFIVVQEARAVGKVDLWAAQPVTKEEALELLNQALLRNGYTAIRKGRTLTIVARDAAKTRALPVKVGSNPESIPQTSELRTQIVPVRFVQAAQLLTVLAPLSSLNCTITANESANTLVITDTEANIHRLMQVIQGIDDGAEDFTVVKVIFLRHANAGEMAEVLAGLFPDESQSQQNSSVPAMNGFGGPGGSFGGGPGGFPGGGFGGFAGGPAGFGTAPVNTSATAGSDNQSRRLKNRAKVVAVADQRTQSIVVTASRDVMPQIQAVIAQLDADPAGKQDLAVHQLKNASARSMAKVLQNTFQRNSSGNSQATANETDALESRSTTQSQANTSNSSATMRGAGNGGSGQSGTAAGGGGGAGGP